MPVIHHTLFTLLFSFFLTSIAWSNELQPFTTDGCTLFPDGTKTQKELWLPCCTEHDFAYWKGGTSVQRKAADNTLKQCVLDRGKPKTSSFMFAGVRLGGAPIWPVPYRWGYGWPFPKKYGELSDDELEEVEKMLEKQCPLPISACETMSHPKYNIDQ